MLQGVGSFASRDKSMKPQPITHEYAAHVRRILDTLRSQCVTTPSHLIQVIFLLFSFIWLLLFLFHFQSNMPMLVVTRLQQTYIEQKMLCKLINLSILLRTGFKSHITINRYSNQFLKLSCMYVTRVTKLPSGRV